MTIRHLWLRLRALAGARRAERDLHDELTFHLDMSARQHAAAGVSEPDARRRALGQFGSTAFIKEECRDARGLQWLDALVLDGRQAWRSVTRAPAFAALAVATFALGIGVNTAVFTLIDAVALKPLPVKDGANVFRLERWLASGARGDVQYTFSVPEYVSFRDHSRTVRDLVASTAPARVASDVNPLVGQLVSDNFFTSLGAPIVAGHAILPAEGSSSLPRPMIVLSHFFWKRRFNADPGAVGTTLTLNGLTCTIVGVTSDDFIGIGNPPQVPDFWAPLSMHAALHPGASGGPGPSLQLVGRLTAGERPEHAQAELTVLAGQFQQTSPPPNGDRTIAMTVEHAKYFGGTNDLRFRASVAILMVCVGMLLIVACANVANMALARASSRQQEIGVRLALGASRGQIVRQLVTESVVLASLGGVAGLLASAWLGRWLGIVATQAVQEFFGRGVRFVLRVAPDVRVFGYAMAMSILAGVFAGLMPAAHAFSPSLATALKNDEGSSFGYRISRSRLRAWLIGAQVAASVALLASAGLLTRGLIRSRGSDPGLETRHMFVVSYDAPVDRVARTKLLRRLVDGLRQRPSITTVTLVAQVPFSGTWTPPIVVDRDPSVAIAPFARTIANYVSPSYFEAFGIPIVRGRTFSAAEATASAPVAIVSESLSRAFWPTADPIGRHLKLDMNFMGQMADFEVVGVAKDVRTANISRIDPSVRLPVVGSLRRDRAIVAGQLAFHRRHAVDSRGWRCAGGARSSARDGRAC